MIEQENNIIYTIKSETDSCIFHLFLFDFVPWTRVSSSFMGTRKIMKRSEINVIMREVDTFLKQQQFHLPPFSCSLCVMAGQKI